MCCPTPRAPDRWDSRRQKELILCSKEFRQISIISSLPPAGNANRWLVLMKDSYNDKTVPI
jgi:hypothetical protein